MTSRAIPLGESGKNAAPLRWLGYSAAIAAVVVLSVLLPRSAAFGNLKASVASIGPWGPPVFALVYALAVGIYLPALPFTVASAALFGPIVGSITAWIGSTAGAGLGFLVIRHLAREAVARRIRRQPRFQAFDESVARSGWRVGALLRLSPMPFVTLNALAGVSSIRFWPFFWATAFGKLPGTIAFVYSIHLGRLGLRDGSLGSIRDDPWGSLSLAVSLLATIASAVYLSRLAKRSLVAKVDAGRPVPLSAPVVRGVLADPVA